MSRGWAAIPCLFISLSSFITCYIFHLLQILLLKNTKYFSFVHIFLIFIFGEMWYNINFSLTETNLMCCVQLQLNGINGFWSKNESKNEGYGFGGKEINLIVGELDFVKWRESRSPLIHVSRKFYLFVKGAIFALFSYRQIENYTAPGLELSQTQGFQLSIKLMFLLEVNKESFLNFKIILS